jgi:hypothetical protein
LAHRGEKNGKVSFWLQPRDYATNKFREKWEQIGSGLSAEMVAEGADAEQDAAPDHGGK